MIIGVGGRPRTGKDTAALRLVSLYGFKSKAFSELIADEFRNKHNREPTKAECQIEGVAGREAHGADIWLKRMIAWAAMHDNVCVPGVRFPNEIEWIQSESGLLWQILSTRNLPDDRNQNFITERSLDYFDNWDHRFLNNTTIDSLWAAIDSEMSSVAETTNSADQLIA